MLAQKDDAGSRRILPWILRVAVFLVVCLVLFVLASATNRLLGTEKTTPAVVAAKEVLAGTRSDTHRFHFTTPDGRQLSTVIPKHMLGGLGLEKGAEVELTLDGLFWSEVVEVPNGDQVFREP